MLPGLGEYGMTDVISTARAARERLAQGLGALQTPGVPESLLATAEPIAQAMAALHRIESSQGAAAAVSAPEALAAVRRALGALQQQPTGHAAVDRALEAVAGSLGMVHSLATVVAQAPAAPAQPAFQPPAPAQPAFPAAVAAPHIPAFAQTQLAGPTPAAFAAPQAIPAPVAFPPQQTAARPAFPQNLPQAGFPQQPPQAGFPQQPPQHSASFAATMPSQPPPAPATAPAVAPQPAARPQPAQPVPAAAWQQPAPAAAPPPAWQQPAPAAPVPPAQAATAPGTWPSAGALPAAGLPRVEAALGAHSPTNFYKGLSGNDVIEAGGLFVATYQILPLDTRLLLKVTLPGGYEFEAQAVVRWTREGDNAGFDGAPPGFGAQFTDISAEGRQLVYRYVRNREPLFHDDL